MATCLCDAFFADVARSTVEVLEHLGCAVEFPGDQTCCGQPPFNGGDFATSRRIARHNLRVFAGDRPIVVPSGSCAAMQFHGNGLQFEGEHDRDAAEALGRRTWEVFDFIVNGLGVTQWTGELRKRIAIHHSCHSRGTGTGAAMRLLLESIEGVEILEFGEAEQCCGFGGTFSVSFPHVSGRMGSVKLDRVLASEPDLVVSADMSCLMHLAGLARVEGRPVETRHAIELLRATMEGGGA
jgi:L-lactate dehydrogenase complex protein LldE